jgi:hypothetical protein
MIRHGSALYFHDETRSEKRARINGIPYRRQWHLDFCSEHATSSLDGFPAAMELGIHHRESIPKTPFQTILGILRRFTALGLSPHRVLGSTASVN